MSTGIPRPLSRTSIELSSFMMTSISVQYPAKASSIELSTTSYTRWCNPFSPISPMYMAGRLRTASSPSRTVILLAEYSPVLFKSLMSSLIMSMDNHYLIYTKIHNISKNSPLFFRTYLTRAICLARSYEKEQNLYVP